MANRNGGTVRLIYCGSGIYRGYDPGTGRRMEVAPGRAVEVSEEKAEQLMRDFPGMWLVDDTVPRPARRKIRRPRRRKSGHHRRSHPKEGPGRL